MSVDAPRDVLLCDKCGKSLYEGALSQCAICGGIYHRECYRLHVHPEHTLEKEPLHEWRT